MTLKPNDSPPHSDSFGSYKQLVNRPVECWYIRPLGDELTSLTAVQQRAVRRQAVIGWLQTVLLAIAILQGLFAGVLHNLPPELKVSLSFLHRVEWAVYLGIVLIVAQVAIGWGSQIVLTNRYFLLAWRLSRPRLLVARRARLAQFGYGFLALALIGALVWVQANGFLVQANGFLVPATR